MASKAVAAAQGPLHAIRGTGEAEKMLKNAKTEYHNEFEEIATYTGIEALAEAVNDKETAKLARGIRREEERMAKFLEKQIPQLAKAVAKEEIPAASVATAVGVQLATLVVEPARAARQRLQPLIERGAQRWVERAELAVGSARAVQEGPLGFVLGPSTRRARALVGPQGRSGSRRRAGSRTRSK